MIQIKNISYTVKNKIILDDISFSIQRGDCIALLGANGSGKTTLLEILTGVLKPTEGTISFDGRNFDKYKRYTGVVWDDITIYPWFKVTEVIKYVSSLYKVKVDDKLYNDLQIDVIANKLMKFLSVGELKRVQILLSLLHNPQLVIMDEGTSELDPYVRNIVWENLLSSDRTIIFTTHNWKEAEEYANKVVFLSNGSLVLEPCDINVLFNRVSLKEKVVIDEIIPVDISPDYILHRKKIFFIQEKDANIKFERIKKQTSKFTVLPIELIDIYQYIINKR